jgi:hypothetical protein
VVEREGRQGFWYLMAADGMTAMVTVLTLYEWIFTYGYYPEWSLVSRLCVFTGITILTTRRILGRPETPEDFSLTITPDGVVIEDALQRIPLTRKSLQGVFISTKPGPDRTDTVLATGIIADDHIYSLPENILGQERLADVLQAVAPRSRSRPRVTCFRAER